MSNVLKNTELQLFKNLNLVNVNLHIEMGHLYDPGMIIAELSLLRLLK